MQQWSIVVLELAVIQVGWVMSCVSWWSSGTRPLAIFPFAAESVIGYSTHSATFSAGPEFTPVAEDSPPISSHGPVPACTWEPHGSGVHLNITR